jgi:hypothetical protein
MKKKFDQVYQFNIALQGIKPPIWRRIQVPETCTFWDLHVAIQDVIGWLDYHLHEFEIMDPSIIKNPDHEEYEEMLEWAGGEFDPEHFDCEDVSFDDPNKRLKMALE